MVFSYEKFFIPKVPFQITGKYHTYKGVSTCQILYKDNTLLFERPEKFQFSIPLIPMAKYLTNNEFYCYLETPISRSIVCFNKKDNGEVILSIEDIGKNAILLLL